LARYQRILTALDPKGEGKADVPNVQQALSALQEKPLVWRAARGVYALEDNAMVEILKQQGLLEVTAG